jgi:uncharacterized delta-60 repeat protein
MNIVELARRTVVICLVVTLGACGGGDDGNETGTGPVVQPPPPAPGIGAAGGTVTGPNGAKVEIPPSALASPTVIEIALTTGNVAPLPLGLAAVGQMFAFTPHGTTFATPVTVTLPFDPASVRPGKTPRLYKTNAQGEWEEVPNATFGAQSVTAQVTSFSNLTGVTPTGDPVRVWSFREFRTDALEEVEVDSDSQTGGDLYEIFEFGPAHFDSAIMLDDGSVVDEDRIAVGDILSTGDGVTYWVGAEAPLGEPNSPTDEPIGSKSRLVQYQTFSKDVDEASYEFVVTAAMLEVIDGNGGLSRPCPPQHVLPEARACDLIKAEVHLDVQAFTANPNEPHRIFFRTAGGASLNGSGGNWLSDAWNETFARTPFWTSEAFDFEIEDFNGPNGAILMMLSANRPYRVDLSSLEAGDLFTVKVQAHAETYNRSAGVVSGRRSEFESAANAFLRDPRTIGGTKVTTTGLTLIDTPLPLADPIEEVVEPAACTPGPAPDPDAGVLQFDAAAYAVLESSTTPTVTVTRTGGSKGAVTVNFTTSDGTAVGGIDYTPVSATVFFADGDAAPRSVAIPVTQDTIAGEQDETVSLALLEPGGCAALGTRTTASLAIRDDDLPPPLPSGLDASFGGDGKVTTEFGGDDTAMALQSDGKIVMVGGSITDFVLARYNADGSLDAGFGSGGLVTTSLMTGVAEEVARAVAIQPDGKIVVAGYTGVFRPGRPAGNRFDFALARYNSDGSLDGSFGTGGLVLAGVIGRAFAMALQPDGKIVVAGDAPFTEDIVVARYDSSGNLDSTFRGGQLITDVNDGAERTLNVVLQSDGAIVVSGPHTRAGDTSRDQHTVVVRYLNTGSPDPAFGAGGVALFEGLRVSEGLALQSDGKVLLTGDFGSGVETVFALMRLAADGSPDGSFGTSGLVRTDISDQGDAAKAVTLQGDGRIIVAGRSSNQVNPNFAVARYLGDGTLDTSFAGTGKLTVDFFGFDDAAENVIVQPDGRIVLGGLARENLDGYGLARIVP